MSKHGWLTPNEIPEATVCRSLFIPDDPEIVAAVSGALLPLTKAYNWELFGTVTPEQMATAMMEMYFNWLSSECTEGDTIPTPFWDDATDLDDQETPALQQWYGEAVDPEAPADEITFIENAAIWIITGFIAYSGQIGAAIFFNTIAPRFTLAWKKGDVGEIIRVVIDSADYGYVDTNPLATDEIISLDILADDSLSSHDILLIKME
jgi:hypothetical protein